MRDVCTKHNLASFAFAKSAVSKSNCDCPPPKHKSRHSEPSINHRLSKLLGQGEPTFIGVATIPYIPR